MIKRIIVLTGLLLTTASLFAQKEVLFKIEYMPGKSFINETEITSNIIMDFQGDEEMISNIKASGVTLPMEITGSQLIASTTKTGLKNAKNETPITIHYDKVIIKQTMNGQENVVPSPLTDVRIEGMVDSKGMINIDSIYGDINQELRQMVSQLIQTFQKQVEFPDKPLKIGDEFTQEIPMDIPLGATAMKLVAKMVYKLEGIKDKKATFGVTQDITLDFSVDQGNAAATGNGSGKMIFDLNTKFITEFDTSIKMDLKMNMDKMIVLGDCSINTRQVVVIK